MASVRSSRPTANAPRPHAASRGRAWVGRELFHAQRNRLVRPLPLRPRAVAEPSAEGQGHDVADALVEGLDAADACHGQERRRVARRDVEPEARAVACCGVEVAVARDQQPPQAGRWLQPSPVSEPHFLRRRHDARAVRQIAEAADEEARSAVCRPSLLRRKRASSSRRRATRRRGRTYRGRPPRAAPRRALRRTGVDRPVRPPRGATGGAATARRVRPGPATGGRTDHRRRSRFPRRTGAREPRGRKSRGRRENGRLPRGRPVERIVSATVAVHWRTLGPAAGPPARRGTRPSPARGRGPASRRARARRPPGRRCAFQSPPLADAIIRAAVGERSTGG